jgi:DNA-binding Xre family transcriptional regulator
MKLEHIHRKIERTPEEKARLRAERERIQEEKPTKEDLLREEGATVAPLGTVLFIHQLAAQLRKVRALLSVSLSELSRRTGIDQAALSRLETGRNENPTVETLCRVATALGKTIRCTLEDAPETPKEDHSSTPV